MKEKLYRFMAGRNGVDLFARFLCYAALVFLILGMFLGKVLRWIGIVLLIYAYFRVFSKNIAARRKENEQYFRTKTAVLNVFRDRRDRLRQRKEYAFFRCPGCKAMLRVPRGKGKIRITCRKCGRAFEKKT